MKIGPYTIQRPWHRETALDADTVPIFSMPARVSYKPKNIKSYYDLYRDHDLVRGMIDDLSESACGQGIYTTVENLSPIFEKNKNKKLCDDFGKEMDLDEILPKIAKNLLIAGYCPVETGFHVDAKKCMVKVVHPVTVKEIVADNLGNVVRIHQKVGKDEKWLPEGEKTLAWFKYGDLANDPKGISFIHSIMSLLTTLDNATNTVSKIAERYIAPIGIWKSRQPSAQLKAAVQGREEGDAIFLGSQTADEMKEETVKFVQVDPRVPFWDYMENLELRVYAYSRASNIWYTKNANLASAEKMEDIVARHVASIQRNIKRTIEKAWYEPLVQLNAGDMEDIPRVNFGKEPTGVEDITPSDIITTGLNLGYINQQQYYEILRTIGVKITESLGDKEEKPEEEEETEEKPEDDTQQKEVNKDKEEQMLAEIQEATQELRKATTQDAANKLALDKQKMANLKSEEAMLANLREKLKKKQ